MNDKKMEFPILNKIMRFMMVFIAGGMLAVVVWLLIKHVYGQIENPMGAVIRLGMMAIFSILIWMRFGKKIRNIDLMNIPKNAGIKCDFCGKNKERTEAGLNKVKYKFKHPNAGPLTLLSSRGMVYGCHDCTNYMIHLWGCIKPEMVDESVQVEKSGFCRIGQHDMCGGLDCTCECHKGNPLVTQ